MLDQEDDRRTWTGSMFGFPPKMHLKTNRESWIGPEDVEHPVRNKEPFGSTGGACCASLGQALGHVLWQKRYFNLSVVFLVPSPSKVTFHKHAGTACAAEDLQGLGEARKDANRQEVKIDSARADLPFAFEIDPWNNQGSTNAANLRPNPTQ